MLFNWTPCTDWQENGHSLKYDQTKNWNICWQWGYFHLWPFSCQSVEGGHWVNLFPWVVNVWPLRPPLLLFFEVNLLLFSDLPAYCLARLNPPFVVGWWPLKGARKLCDRGARLASPRASSSAEGQLLKREDFQISISQVKYTGETPLHNSLENGDAFVVSYRIVACRPPVP